MANKACNAPYDQIPHIVVNHPHTNPEHQSIMWALYKALKDNLQIVYSNEKLSKSCKIPLRTVERRIPELVEMGFINSTGRGRNRRLELGLLFHNSATVAVVEPKSESPTAKSESPTAKSDLSNRHRGGEYKYNNKHYTKGDDGQFYYNPAYQEYVLRIKADIFLGIESQDAKILPYEEWVALQ